MKTNCWLVLGMMLATSAVAQVNTNTLPDVPAPATVAPAPEAVVAPPAATTNAPAKKAAAKHKKHTVKKAAKPVTAAKAEAKSATTVAETAEAPATLLPGFAEVTADHVNVRGQAGLKGEVLTHLKKGDQVTVVAVINLDKHPAGEPAHWAKIVLPADTKAWVNAKFVDATTKTVSAKKLNVRGGPGENYSVLGVLEQGAAVNQTSSKGDWWQIDPPTNVCAFVAASLLKQSAAPAETAPAVVAAAPAATPPAAVVESTPPAPPAVPATTNTLTEAAPIVASPAATVTDTNVPAAATTPPVVPPAVAATTAPTNIVPPVVPPDEDTNVPPPPRIVTHEGIVHGVRSIIAPTYYELDDQVTSRSINYLYTTTTNLDLSHYKGLHVIVTGEESLAARWKNTPLLTIQRIQVVE